MSHTISTCIYLLSLILSPLVVTLTSSTRTGAISVRPPRYRTLYACEGSALEIICEEGTHINLIRANFGRFSISVCNDNGNVDWRVDCMSHRSFRVMQESCGMKRSCKLPASANMFGDPCPGTLKYLEAHYQCMPDNASPYSTARPPNHSFRNPIIPSYESGADSSISISNNNNNNNNKPSFESTGANSSPNPRIIFPESYNPSQMMPFPAIEMDSGKGQGSEVSQTEFKTKQSIPNNSDNSAQQPIDAYPRINENDIPPPVNPPIISDNETPLINTDSDKTGVNTNNRGDNSNNAHQYYSSTPESKWITSGSDADSINTNKHNTITNNNNNYINNNMNNDNNDNLNNDNNIMIHENSDKLVDLTIDHCPPAFSRGLSWNWTLAGHVANQSCPAGTQGLARWSCVYLNGRPQWTQMKADMSDCSSLWVSHLEHRLNSKSEPIVSLADELAKGCREKTLFGGDLFRATDIINHLVLRTEGIQYETHDEQQRNHVVREMLNSVQDIVSSLLDDRQVEAWSDLSTDYQKSAITSQINALERLALLLAEIKTQTSDYLRAHQNIFLSIHIRSIQSVSHGLHLPPIVDTIEELPNAVTLHSNSIYLSPQTLTDQSTAFGVVKVIFVMYKKLGHLLKPKTESTVMLAADGGLQSLNVSRVINSDVFGLHLNTERYTQLSEPIEFTLKHLITDNVTNAKCVYWDIDRRDWSDQGCYTIRSNRTHTSCKCNHLTNFAILMDVNNVEISSGNELALRVITVIGCTVSIICLTITFITLVSFRSLRSVRTTIHTNLCLCLIIAELIFLLGINETKVKLICGLIACGLHYFFLSAFLWMFFEGFQLYVMLIEVFDHEKSRVNWYYLLSYGVPAILVIISAIIDPLSYGTSKYCWLRSDNYFIWAFVGPVIAILLANIVFLAIAMTTMCRHIPHITANKTKEQTKLTNIKIWIRGSLALVFLLGITWSFGLLYLSRESLFMAYLFTICNSLQGMFIFVFNCLTNEKVRTEYRKLFEALNLKPVCLDSTPSKSMDTTREQIPSSSLTTDHRTSLYVNNTANTGAHKDATAINMFPVANAINCESIVGTERIVNNAAPNGVNMGALMMAASAESPKLRRMTQKYYLTDDTSSDYGCKRLAQSRCPKNSCRDLYGLHSAAHLASHSPNFIEHIYECIDEDPYVAKLLLPAIQRSLDGQHARTLSDSSRHSDNRPLISCSTSSPRSHNFHIQTQNTGNHLPAIVKDNTNNKTTIICSNQLSNQQQSQPSMAVLNGNQVICCTLNDHQLCDHNIQQQQQPIGAHLRQQYLVTNGLNNLNHCLTTTKSRHLTSDC
ncbi:adhesion G protein-coupled receptor L3-like isoform X2 [Oppia nitens]|uniref:adhesion G protein-coupled receptor L3-like isoform X2 n=1 Tax=Oppia nitens TaxID=1686743 RepID=UPI0023D9C0FE|nr:adhesion G protein-coupled receptor L3-like isoform X2 [Oppia nitens]